MVDFAPGMRVIMPFLERNLLYRRNVCFMLHLSAHKKAHISQAMVESQNFCVKETVL